MVNVAEETVDWLRTEHLRAAEEWSYLLPTGFSWWADHYLQTIEIVGEETGPTGESGYLVCVRTELLRDLDLTEAALAEINSLPMRCASMAGPVYDVPARRLDLWSLVRVTDDNGDWIRFLLGAAAVAQLAEARMLAPLLAQAVGALPATSDHPESGRRDVPDQMAYAAGTFVHSGDRPSAWTPAEFADAVSRYMNRPPVSAAVEGNGVSVEFPFGDQTSSCRLAADQPHPLYGNGLLVLQRFPVQGSSEDEGIRMALSLNAADLTRQVTGYGLGSYVYADGLPDLLRLVEAGAYVKATGFGRLDFDPGPAMKQILAINPHALVFGTDLPSTRAPRPFSDNDLTGLADLLGPEGSANVLWHNAAALYLRRS